MVAWAVHPSGNRRVAHGEKRVIQMCALACGVWRSR
jgi:hypothetical protein